MSSLDKTAVRINQILSDRLTNAGLTPGVTDLRRSDAFPILFRQVLNALGSVSLDVIANSDPIANTDVETAFGPAATHQLAFPAGALNVAGTRVNFKAGGTLATTSTPTMTFGARLGGVGGTVVGNASGLPAANNSTAAPWRLKGGFVVRTTGATGTLLADNMQVQIVNAASGAGAAPRTSLGNTGVAASAATDLTAALDLVLTANWSASSASNVITMTYFNVEVIRAES